MQISSSKLLKIILAIALLSSLVLVNIKSSTSANQYDPWADYNGDGVINIQDVGPLTAGWLASGNPTRNVTITGRANKLAFTTIQPVDAYDTYDSPWISVDGYSKFTVCLYCVATSNYYQLKTMHTSGFNAFFVDTEIDFGSDLVKTYDVPNQMVSIAFTNGDAVSRTLFLDVYLVP